MHTTLLRAKYENVHIDIKVEVPGFNWIFLNMLILPLFLGHETGTLKKTEEIKLLLSDMGPPDDVMMTSYAEWLVFYKTKHKLVGVFYKKRTLPLSYGIRHGFTLRGHFTYAYNVGGDRFITFLYDYRPTCTKGACGSWMLYSARTGKLEAKVGRFCLGRPCHDDEGDEAYDISCFFDYLHSNQGTIIANYGSIRLSGRKQKRSIVVSYRFVMVRGQIERAELQTLVKSGIIPLEGALKLYLRTFATPDPGDIFVSVQIKSKMYEDYYLYILHKSNGFKKEEIFREKFPSELKVMGKREFDPVMNRMFYMSRYLQSHNPVIKAIQLDCDGKVIIIDRELNITYVWEFKKWKGFAVDQTGNVFIIDFFQTPSAELYRVVPEIH
jgi:hypothetical protein